MIKFKCVTHWNEIMNLYNLLKEQTLVIRIKYIASEVGLSVFLKKDLRKKKIIPQKQKLIIVDCA